MKDLIVAVADSYQEKVMEALLLRVPISSGTKDFSFDIIKNSSHDPAVIMTVTNYFAPLLINTILV